MTEPNYRACCGDQDGPGHNPDAAEDCHPCDCDCHTYNDANFVPVGPNKTARGGSPTYCVRCGALSDWCALRSERCCAECTHRQQPGQGETFEQWRDRYIPRGTFDNTLRHGRFNEIDFLNCWRAAQAASAKPIDPANIERLAHRILDNITQSHWNELAVGKQGVAHREICRFITEALAETEAGRG